MWIESKSTKPKHEGHYIAATLRDGKIRHEIVYFHSQTQTFSDKDRDDFVGIDESVKFWMDISRIPCPISRELETNTDA